MVSDKDIYISANLLIKQYGDQAEQFALDMLENRNGGNLWVRILRAIEVLKNENADILN